GGSFDKLLIGNGGAATVSQIGSSVLIVPTVSVGVSAPGTYLLADVSDLRSATQTIGDGYAGSFIQSGGTNEVSSSLIVGNSAGLSTYTLTGGTVTVGGQMRIGVGGSALFSQSGG